MVTRFMMHQIEGDVLAYHDMSLHNISHIYTANLHIENFHNYLSLIVKITVNFSIKIIKYHFNNSCLSSFWYFTLGLTLFL